MSIQSMSKCHTLLSVQGYLLSSPATIKLPFSRAQPKESFDVVHKPDEQLEKGKHSGYGRM